MSEVRSPFGWDHEVWVRHGWCPVIRRVGAWCNLRAGHGGDHMSPRFDPDGSVIREFWPDSQ